MLKTDQKKAMDRVKKLELDVTIIKPQTEDLQGQVAELTKRVGCLKYRAEDSEGRARRNNIRIVGLPEKIEGHGLPTYLEEWIRKDVAPEGLSNHFALEPRLDHPPGQPPHLKVARLLHFKDRDTILQKAREIGEVKWTIVK